ncbi:MAG: 2-phospho-L-lactate guanylyltransferase [Anaerolineales bacterium]|nr:2-phospho-L-lactate guanylyltransferase [Anaerolineales bacterium]
MTFWAIVPVKPLRRGKSRLAGILSESERTDLNKHLLSHTLDTIKSIPEIEQILVVSRDPAALALARSHGARTLLEDGLLNLNVALTRATIVVQEFATHGVLIMPADLPLITPEDLKLMMERVKDPPVVVVAPDRRGEGTNALIICPPGLIEYDFGVGSFERHCDRARKAGARLEICELSSLALDVDIPEDLELVSFELDKGYETEKIDE